MNCLKWLTIGALGVSALAATSALATEPGGSSAITKPGILIDASAGVPPPGVYMFDQAYTYQAKIAGPITGAIGSTTHVSTDVAIQGFLFVPGWTFLGATYDAVIVQPEAAVSINSPFNAQSVGVYNTYIVPGELSWKLGGSGFAAKAGVGFWAPTGTVSGPAGISNVGTPYWTIQPELILSYLKDGWNISTAIYEEFHTANTVTGYRTGDVLHADFTATKTFGKWTVGPVGYYVGQVSHDQSSAFYANVLGTQRFDVWAVGGLVGYNFGSASLNVWATQEVYAKASGATIGAFDPSDITRGFTVLASLSYRLWAPDEAPAKRPFFTK
jgi:hypothetical protein